MVLEPGRRFVANGSQLAQGNSYRARGQQVPSPHAVPHSTALHGAAQHGYNSVVELLVERGADLTIRDASGSLPLDVAMGEYQEDFRTTRADPLLDTASLIPREVQAAFPGVRSYLPRDALLTDADIARARKLGAELSKADENTIYIPVQDQKPAGTAIIFPARWQGKDFFLLLATDRQLKVTRVQPLHASKVPEAGKSKVYAGFVGVAVNELPAAQGDALDAAITRAVKKAGTLLYVRLKSA